LLEDLAEVDRFEAGFALNVPGGEALSGPAQVRLFKSNLAVLPNASQAFQWRLADIERLEFDAHSYEIVLERDGQQLRLNRVGKYTERAQTRLRQAYDGLRAEAAQALHTMLPFLNATQLRAVAERMPEGHSAPVGELAIIDPRIPQTLTANAVDKTLRPYYDELLRRSRSDLLYAGFKVIRSDDESLRRALEEDVASRADLGGEAAQGDLRVDGRNAVHEEGAVPLVLQWFFFPLVVQGGSALRNVVAWEACTGSGRATYFLRLLDAAEAPALQDVGGAPSAVKRGVDRITRVLGLLNFRRRPIYLPDDELQGNASFHRYAIASRRIAELRWVRGAFLGRALHSSFDAWRAQVEAILQSARD